MDQKSMRARASSMFTWNDASVFWQYTWAITLMLSWSAFFCVFLEGKSAYDLAFTLWDDRFAKLPAEPMGEIIIPQMIMYLPFLLATAILVAIAVTKPSFPIIMGCILVGTMIMLLVFTGFYSAILEQYPGDRHGPVGWTILEWPWLSLALFCATSALGLVSAWILIARVFPSSTNNGASGTSPGGVDQEKGMSANMARKSNMDRSFADGVKNWIRATGRWRVRILSIAGIVLGCLALNATLVNVLDNINTLIWIGMVSTSTAMIMLMVRKDKIFASIGKREAPARTGKIATAFLVNPKNFATRPVRNAINGVLAPLCLGFMAAMSYMTVPDEWVFIRFMKMLPWIMLGAISGIGIMTLFPEPSVYFAATISYSSMLYNRFLDDFSLPFDMFFINFNGFLLGFWVGVVLSMLFLTYRARSTGRNLHLMLVLVLSMSLTWMFVSFVDRFQESHHMVQEGVTAALEVVFPILKTTSVISIVMNAGIWLADIPYRLLTRRHGTPRPRKRFLKDENRIHRYGIMNWKPVQKVKNLASKKKKLIALAISCGFIASLAMVQGFGVRRA
ncbi:hypothetical protein GF325_02580, partial [Candidatus Bathyarchaeota archaeon]|nr:hypothetical protein [Candidatus Bathyarchaeota archaeon]